MKSRNNGSSLVLTPRKYEQAVPLQPGGREVVRRHRASRGWVGGGEVVTTLVRTCRAISSVDDFGDANVHKFIPWYLHIDAPLLNTTEIIKTLCG